jgi:glucose-fructose oxidoreductase
MKTINTAFFGVCHPHASILYNSFKGNERFSLIGYADTDDFDELTHEERLENLGAGKEMKKFQSWQELLDQTPDLAIVASTNTGKTEICMEILSRGIPVIVEKPLSFSYEDGKKLVDCAIKHNTKIITNWPIAWFPAFRKAKELADSGEVGKVQRVVYRSPATWGPYSYSPDGALPSEDFLKRSWWYKKDFGGGSILDYACYGAMLSTWIFGRQAKQVKAIKKQFTTEFSDVEDFSAMLLDFGDGVGLLEGSWSSFNPAEIPSGPIIYGTDGVIVCDRHSNLVKIYHGKSHKPVKPTQVFETAQVFDCSRLAPQILDYLDNGAELDEMLDMPLNLMVMYALSEGIKDAQAN